MPKRRDPTERLLQELAEHPQDTAVLARALATGHGFVVASAAQRVKDHAIGGLDDALSRAFADLAARGRAGDPGCNGRAAIVAALAAAEARAWEVYEQGLATVQLEPVMGGQVDTAGEVRARSLLALVHLRPVDALDRVAESLADPLPAVRLAAALAAGDTGERGATALLRLKIALGDEDPEVTGAAVASLVSLAPAAGLLVAERILSGRKPALRESVGLALGQSRDPAVLPALRAWAERVLHLPERDTALTAVALLRQPDGERWLITQIATGDRAVARAGIRALRPFRHDPAVVAAVVAAAGANGALPRSDVEELGFG